LSRVAMRSVTASSSMTQGPLIRKKGVSGFIQSHLSGIVGMHIFLCILRRLKSQAAKNFALITGGLTGIVSHLKNG
jgi:hypothetical protein